MNKSKNLNKNLQLARFVTVAAVLVAAGILFGNAHDAVAFTTPATGDLGYDLYDIAINKILLGPSGYVGAAAFVVLGAILLVRQMVLWGVGMILSAAVLFKANTIVESLGALIS